MSLQDKIKNAEVTLWPFGMGMTIEEAMNYLIAPKIASTEVTPEMQKQLDAHAIAIDTMRKYQKIQEIYERFQKDGNYYHHMAWLDVMEVLKDGSN